jgi:hypothetical protein
MRHRQEAGILDKGLVMNPDQELLEDNDDLLIFGGNCFWIVLDDKLIFRKSYEI